MNATRKRDRLKMDFMNYAELREFMCPGYDAMQEALQKTLMNAKSPHATDWSIVVERIEAALALASGEPRRG